MLRTLKITWRLLGGSQAPTKLLSHEQSATARHNSTSGSRHQLPSVPARSSEEQEVPFFFFFFFEARHATCTPHPVHQNRGLRTGLFHMRASIGRGAWSVPVSEHSGTARGDPRRRSLSIREEARMGCPRREAELPRPLRVASAERAARGDYVTDVVVCHRRQPFCCPCRVLLLAPRRLAGDICCGAARGSS